MAEEAVAAAPAPAPASAPNPGSAVPPSSGSINVVPQPIAPVAPPKPGTAKARMFEELRKKGGPGTQGSPSDPPKPAAKAASGDGSPEGVIEPPGGEPTETPPGGTPATEPDKKKVSPWKLVDEWKGKYASLEKQVSELKKGAVPDSDRKSFEDRVTKAEARAKELEDHIRFVDYSKSQEFKEKYQVPYERAWGRAMADLKELTIETPQGERAVAPEDVLTLLNLPLGQARELADKVFGPFADDVMAHRKELKSLYDAQNQAMEDAKKNGEERVKQGQEQMQRQMSETKKHIADTWAQENEAVTKHEKYGKYFTPVDGDQEGNQLLAKGFELVDRAFKENPLDPKLTAEERANIVRRHAAVRNRAAAFGRLRAQIEKRESEIAQLRKDLEEYKKGEPGANGQPATGGVPGARPSAKQSVMDGLRRIAK